MTVDERYAGDVEKILSRRHDNGADLWATPDGKLLKGAPWSTIECASFLAELGMDPATPVLRDAAELIFAARRPDGRFRTSPGAGIYPCHTALAARTLCALGYAHDPRLAATIEHLATTTHTDGGWRCAKFSYGRGPETEASTPLTTLFALDVLRYTGRRGALVDDAVEFLLDHWTTRAPLGPCHYGIGSLFMQVEYPMRGYNLFSYVYVLSFYSRARADARFAEALAALAATTVGGSVVVQRVVPKLAGLTFCRKGEPSAAATARWHEILARVGRPGSVSHMEPS